MYPEVKAEMGRHDITLNILASDPEINCTVGTMSLKLQGKAPISFKEAVAIKRVLKSKLSLEELFAETETDVEEVV